MKVASRIKKHWVFFLVLAIGVFLRFYKSQELFLYSHDQDLIGWFIRDVLENKHLRLIGQETSSRGLFIGPAFYYAMIPFYLLVRMDPIGGVLFSTLLGVATIASIYFVIQRIFTKNAALIASFVYAISFYTVLTDREVVPTTPAMLWTVWFLYAIDRLLRGKHKEGLLLLGILAGFIWHINLALALLMPVAILALFLSKKLPKVKEVAIGALAAILISLPLMLFELRHNFMQTNAVFGALTASQNTAAKLDRTIQLVNKNVTNIFYRTNFGFPVWFVAFILVSTLLFLITSKRISWKLGILMLLWQVMFIFFFTRNPINLSEYYINGMNIIWITIFAVSVSQMLTYKHYLPHVIVLLSGFLVVHIQTFFALPVNKSGYLERKAIVQFIKSDAAQHSYPCVSVSYITSPGNNLGYRYLFYLAGLHVNQPKSGSPVYSIVFPHSMVDQIDHSFGALGLVLPDYSRYNKESVDKSCMGDNANLTDPVFGFTK